jgi:hypothetical protein
MIRALRILSGLLVGLALTPATAVDLIVPTQFAT